MGHASVTHLSKATLSLVYAKGKASINDVLLRAMKLPEHKSEVEYDVDAARADIGMLIVEVVNFLLKPQKFTPQSTPTPVLEPCDMTERQAVLFRQFMENADEYGRWTCTGDPDNPGDWDLFTRSSSGTLPAGESDTPISPC